eukprot:gene7957-9487_t
MISPEEPVISTVEEVLTKQLLAAEPNYVPMISLIGSTGSGKSFLASSFMAEGSDSAHWPTVAEDEQTVPTTAHVCIYKGKLRVGSRMLINLLDLEGESRHSPKTLVRNLAGMAQSAAASIPLMSQFFKDTAAARATIIKHTMPRMAYLLSDVVIFVDTIELRRDEFIDRVKSFALEAHKSCNSVGWRPALILISNKWSPAIFNPANVNPTAEYDDIVQELSSLFSQIAIMRIPCANACRHNLDFVDDSIDQVHRKIDEFVSRVQQMREHHNCLYGEKKTWYLFREIVKWVNRDHMNENPIKSLSELYENEVQRSSVGNCLKALDMYGDHLDDSALFVRNVSHVLRWYAYLAACDRKLGIHGETDLAELHRAVVDRCYAAEQCSAIYTAPDGNVYHCRQNCQGHEDFHSNPAVVRVPAQNLFWRIFGEEELLSKFSHFQPQDLGTKAPDFDLCCLCLTSYDENVATLSKCHHILCEECLSKRQQLSPVVTDVPLCFCPFCRNPSPCPPFVPEEFVGFRVLSLDGGGVKGLVEVKVLQKIEEYFHPLRITNLFDVIVGTSAGGIIAMALRKNISLERISAYLEHMAKNVLDVETFTYFFRLFTNQSICNTSELESVFKEMLGLNSNFSYNVNQLQPPYIYCTAFDELADRTALFGSSKALNRVATREELLAAGVGRVHTAKLWEAARATSAAPTFFTPFHLTRLDGSALTMLDGGLGGGNCPAHLAMRVAKVLQRKGRGMNAVDGKIDMCLSLGTGTNMPNVVGHQVNGLTRAGKLIDSALDSERIWTEKCVESPEFTTIKDRIRINPPNLGSLNAFASASIPQLHDGMKEFFQTAPALDQMRAVLDTMYAKLWHVRVGHNPVTPIPYTFAVSLRDLRFDFNGLDEDELRAIIVKRDGAVPPAGATHYQLVDTAKDAYLRKPVVADITGHFGCKFNGVDYHSNNGAFEIPTAGLLPGAFVADVYWQTEAGYCISISGFPTFWEVGV